MSLHLNDMGTRGAVGLSLSPEATCGSWGPRFGTRQVNYIEASSSVGRSVSQSSGSGRHFSPAEPNELLLCNAMRCHAMRPTEEGSGERELTPPSVD